MIAEWQVRDLVALVRGRYPDWEGFDHPAFVADELAPKRALVARAQRELSKGEFRRLLEAADYDTLIERLNQLGKSSNLLWNNVPQQGDLALLHAPHLDKWAFCEQMRQLLYDQRPSPDKLHLFSTYCQAHQLPNRWPLATFFMFLVRPQREIFIKPSVAKWFLQFMGVGDLYTSTPTADMYERYKKNCHGLRAELAEYGATDMVDIQSIIFVAYQESEKRTAGLDLRGRVELEQPPAVEEAPEAPDMADWQPIPPLREPEAPYHAPFTNPLYPLAQMAADTGYELATLTEWTAALRRKKQVVFYGPPGTGKSFMARKLAEQWVGGTTGLVEVVQFHPAYDYVDFVEGLRPHTTPGGQVVYTWEEGRLLDFCGRARQHSAPCVLLIDELNRANLPQVFGELMYLLEYRAQTVHLASGRLFQLPDNVYLIATMNTADRSIALVDHALRRRFAFVPLWPNYDVLRHFHGRTGYNPEPLIQQLTALNQAIADPHYGLGISYFLHPHLAAELPTIWRMEVEPYLEEYFFNRPDQLANWRWPIVSRNL